MSEPINSARIMRDQTVRKIAWLVHRACGCNGCPPDSEDWQGARNVFDQVVAPLVEALAKQDRRIAEAWNEGATAMAQAYGTNRNIGPNPYLAALTQDQPVLPVNRCLLSGPHEPHDWWYTSWGGGHMLSGEPTDFDWRMEKNLKQHHCPGAALTQDQQ